VSVNQGKSAGIRRCAGRSKVQIQIFFASRRCARRVAESTFFCLWYSLAALSLGIIAARARTKFPWNRVKL
jgi:hypothetical protein